MSDSKKHSKLGELAATAISGNDISSSCLYVSALAIVYSGQYAWIALLMVAAVLFLYRKIYGEVVGALPLNGGAYNALLNTTSKSTASVAATLTILSYMATAVISANEAMHYLHSLWEGIPVIIATIILLSVFMILSIIGISESAVVAIFIFIFHLSSLVILSSLCFYYLFENGFTIFEQNNAQEVPYGSVTTALFFGFSAAMLGISGFESSANFVEEQKKGVFPKTLRNMWVVVSIINPLIAFLALSMLTTHQVGENQNALLSVMGEMSGGSWLATLVSIDAVLVLSGAVLTSFVGVTGLIHRMTLDRVLPPFLLKQSKNGSYYLIAILFFLLCVSILLITKGELGALAGVYTISFLSVMALFGVGNILLKVRRKNLPRPERSTWIGLLVAIVAIIIAILGNALLNPPYLVVFFEYFLPVVAFVFIMLNRIPLLKLLLLLIEAIFKPIQSFLTKSNYTIMRLINRINSVEFVYFTKGDNIATLNKVMLYIKKNENTKRIKIVTVFKDDVKPSDGYLKDLDVLDREYPNIKIEFIAMKGEFGPELIEKCSKEWKIPVNFMFIASPGDSFPYRLEELGGVRLII
ncbi:APC family permease [Flavobacteriaceae bacterium]|nr:APC family permease [Flavobacteriaceae bacterium]